MATKNTQPIENGRRAVKRSGANKPDRSKNLASLIMPAPRGKRTVSHRRIKAAVEAVFRSRAKADA